MLRGLPPPRFRDGPGLQVGGRYVAVVFLRQGGILVAGGPSSGTTGGWSGLSLSRKRINIK